MQQDRRESQRKPVLVRATLEFQGKRLEAMTTDMSQHGAFFRTNDCPPIGTPVVVHVEGGNDGPVRMRSAVARHENASVRGIGLTWAEAADPMLNRCITRPAANSDRGPVPSPQPMKSTGAKILQNLSNPTPWVAELEATADSSTDPFASIETVTQASLSNGETAWNEIPFEAPVTGKTVDSHSFKAGTPIRFRVEGKWMVGRVRSVDDTTLQISSHWSIPLEGHVVHLASAVIESQKFQVNEATGVVERVEAVGSAGRQGGVFSLRLIHG